MIYKEKIFLLVLCMIAIPAVASAHASEQGLVMLLPTELYTLGGTLAVGASIILMGFFPIRVAKGLFKDHCLDISPQVKTIETSLSLLALFAFLVLILIGILGPNDPQSNLLPLFIWTGWWVGVFVIQGLVFDIWRLLNPWSGLAKIVLSGSTAVLKVPKRLGHWPAVGVFLIFQLFLLADIAPNDPERLATFAFGYWLFTFAGILLFGTEPWLSRVECFTVLFRLIGTLRIVQVQNDYRLGLPGWASIAIAPLTTSKAVFCIIILISGSFDGLHETFWWLGNIGINPLEFPGRSAVVWSSAAGLLVANIVGISVYAISIWLGLGLVSMFGDLGKIKFMDAFNTFAVAILPIALGYHFAHYFISFLVQVQYLLATLADPLAKGWNLFGLDRMTITTGFLKSMDSVRPILMTNLTAIVCSHIVSVILAHRLAGRFCTRRREMILIQSGLSLLMLIYTIFGLWLLTTPRGA